MTAAITLVLFAVLAAADDPVVLEFTTANCPACRKAEPVVRGLAHRAFPSGKSIPHKASSCSNFKFAATRHSSLFPADAKSAASKESPLAMIGHPNLPPRWSPAFRRYSFTCPKGVVAGHRRSSSVANPLKTAAAPPSPLPEAALAATVRLRVNEGTTDGIGTGTIIDTHFNEEHKADEAR